jgi:hypothetical protein
MNDRMKSKWLKTRLKNNLITDYFVHAEILHGLADAMFLATESYYGNFVHYYSLGKV